MKQDTRDITTALADYFDGIYEGDTAKLRRAFHAEAHLYSATDGPLTDMSLEDYLALVGGRPSPASRNAPRADRIVAIDYSGPETAMAKVELSVSPKNFVDFLTMLRVDGRWRIISKTFHYTLDE